MHLDLEHEHSSCRMQSTSRADGLSFAIWAVVLRSWIFFLCVPK
jgi:hypothetical protein